jgi:hypothetical protein
MGEKNIKNNQNAAVVDYKELVDFMAVKFDEINNKLDQNADKLGIEKINQVLETKADKSDIALVLTRIAMLGNKIDDYREEQIGMRKQLDKHEKWHFKTAAKVGIDLLAD